MPDKESMSDQEQFDLMEKKKKVDEKRSEFENQLKEIDHIIDQNNKLQKEVQGNIQAALKTSEFILAIKERMTNELMERCVMPLMGNVLGFRTDRDLNDPKHKDERKRGEKYSMETVKECCIVAMLKGAQITNNEFNIIAHNTYFTKNFFARKLKEMDNLTDLKIDYGMPQVNNDRTGALINCSATWKSDGKDFSMDCPIPMKIEGKYTTVDGMIGKAERKMMCRIYNRIMGTEFTEGEVEYKNGKSVIDPDPGLHEAKDHKKKLDSYTHGELCDIYDKLIEKYTFDEILNIHQKLKIGIPKTTINYTKEQLIALITAMKM